MSWSLSSRSAPAPAEHHAARLEHVGPVRGAERHARVLLDEQDGRARLAERREEPHDLLHDEGRQAERRLVAQEQPRPAHQRAADGEHLLLAARQRARELRAPLAQHGKQAIGLVHARRRAARRKSRAAGQRVAAQLEVVEHGEVAEDAAPLRHQRDARAEDRLGRLAGHVAPVERARGRPPAPMQPGDGAEQRRLARAVGADQRHQLARAHLEGDVAERGDGAVARGRARSPQATAATSSPR